MNKTEEKQKCKKKKRIKLYTNISGLDFSCFHLQLPSSCQTGSWIFSPEDALCSTFRKHTLFL